MICVIAACVVDSVAYFVRRKMRFRLRLANCVLLLSLLRTVERSTSVRERIDYTVPVKNYLDTTVPLRYTNSGTYKYSYIKLL